MSEPTSPRVSVVVIGRNEGQRLRHCLDSIRSMVLPEGGIELIYVDSASRDGSAALAAELGAHVVRLAKPFGAAAARNAGWRVARADTVLFLDGDTVLDPRFVVDSLTELDDPAVAVVWGHRREMAPEASPYQRILDLDWVYAPGPSEFCGGDALVRKAALYACHGFNETLLAGEEPEMCSRLRALGYAIVHVDRPMTRHDLSISRWSQYWRRTVRAGHAYAAVAETTRGSQQPLWNDVVRRNRLHAAIVLGLPALSVGLALMGRTTAACLPIAMLLGLMLRSSLRMRWKSPGMGTLLLYGIHSHLQQVAILEGQLLYYYDAWRGRRRGLIEYKGVATCGER